MQIKFDDTVFTDAGKSGSCFTLPAYQNLEDDYKTITVTDDDGNDTVYTNAVIMFRWWSGTKFYIAFREKTEEEIAADTEAALKQIDNAADLFPDWSAGAAYKAGNRVLYDGKLYKVLQGHTSQGDWKPDAAASLFTPVHGATASDDGEVTVDEWPEFVQPTGSHDAYKKGDKITYAGKHYISLIDANVYSPDAYAAGWQEQA